MFTLETGHRNEKNGVQAQILQDQGQWTRIWVSLLTPAVAVSWVASHHKAVILGVGPWATPGSHYKCRLSDPTWNSWIKTLWALGWHHGLPGAPGDSDTSHCLVLMLGVLSHPVSLESSGSSPRNPWPRLERGSNSVVSNTLNMMVWVFVEFFCCCFFKFKKVSPPFIYKS